ncbi:hypothetical protein Pelo_17866 [Pelomyxa schiedti]|nr:hypothetical protein Pelo_17866 [Pelomyxa schiedti]
MSSSKSPQVIDTLLSAVRRGDAEATRTILARNPDVDINAEYDNGETTLLHEAGSAAVARLLLTSPPPPHRPFDDVNRMALGNTALYRACRDGREDVVRELLGVDGVRPNDLGELWVVANSGNAVLARLLLEHPGTDVNAGLYGTPVSTPLGIALISANLEVAEMIVARGGTMNKESKAEVYKLMGGKDKYKQWLINCHCEVENQDKCRIAQLEEEVSALNAKLALQTKGRDTRASDLKAQNEILKAQVAHWIEENLKLQERVQSLTDDIQKEKRKVEQMISLIPADVSDFTSEKLLGTGTSAAAFKVRFSNGPSSSVGTTAATSTSTNTMVMKVLFNWESTPRHTRLRQKYMAECVILSSIPPHQNVIHPLGALVIPRFPDEFIQQIPASKPIFREMALNKSLAFIMPFGGIPLSSFLQSLLVRSSSSSRWDETVNLFHQALKAVNHIETNKVIHRDIKEDNLLVDPVTKTLSLIDFGEATRCLKPDLEVVVSSDMQLWGNAGTIPPELSALSRTLRATGPTLFSYSKCDSFAVAVTFWDALMPQQHKFIGSTLNSDMASFTPTKLAAKFPDPLAFFHTTSQSATKSTSTTNKGIVMKEVMVGMMAPDKHTRTSCVDAIQSLLLH